MIVCRQVFADSRSKKGREIHGMIRRSPEQLTIFVHFFAFKFIHLSSSLCERMVSMIEEYRQAFRTTLSILPPAVLVLSVKRGIRKQLKKRAPCGNSLETDVEKGLQSIIV